MCFGMLKRLFSASFFRFLLRVLVTFPDQMDRLGITDYLCELIRAHPRLTPSPSSAAAAAAAAASAPAAVAFPPA